VNDGKRWWIINIYWDAGIQKDFHLEKVFAERLSSKKLSGLAYKISWK